jgi:HK97 family phage major capsid protein
MARQTYEAWLPEEKTSQVIGKIRATSAIESIAKRVPMSSDSKTFPRSGTVTVDVIPKGTAYGEDVSPNDEVTMVAKKLGRAVRIAEEDIDDTIIDVINEKKLDWASAYARYLDNACLGVNAAIGAGVPFTSVYRAVTQADAFSGYVANANRQTSNDPGYDELSEFLAAAEGNDYFDEASLVMIAHPYWKSILRGMKDTAGRPLWVEGLAGTPDTIFGYRVRWTVGAKVTATATSTPAATPTTTSAAGAAGNPLLIAANPDFLMLGVRSGPESVVIPGRDGVSALTDETILKMRARRGFLPAFADGFVVLEKTHA